MNDVLIIRCNDSGFDNYSEYEVAPSTVGQYTGLTDKNGGKIFEGDFVRDFYDKPCVYVTEFCNGGFVERELKTGAECEMESFLLFETFDGEVIGNIHDNPELLEDKP